MHYTPLECSKKKNKAANIFWLMNLLCSLILLLCICLAGCNWRCLSRFFSVLFCTFSNYGCQDPEHPTSSASESNALAVLPLNVSRITRKHHFHLTSDNVLLYIMKDLLPFMLLYFYIIMDLCFISPLLNMIIYWFRQLIKN